MPAVGVVPAGVPQDLGAGLVAGVEFEVSELLDLEGCEKAFGRSVVPAVALAAHAADDACGLQRLAIVAAGILAAAVGVMHEPRFRTLRTDGQAQRAEHQMAVDLLRHGPADDAAGMQFDEDRKIEPALSRPDVGDVAHPSLIRAAGMKGSGKDVWRNLELMIRVRCGLKTAPCAGHEAAASHGTGHARAAAAQAALVQFPLHAPAAVAHLAF